MYVVTVKFDIRAGQIGPFMKAMKQQAGNSLRLEPGCRVFDVCVDPSAENRVFLYEKYTDQNAFQAHLDSDHFKDFDAQVKPWVVDKQVETWIENK